MTSKPKSRTFIVLHNGFLPYRGYTTIARYRVGARNEVEAEKILKQSIGKHVKVRTYYEEKEKLLQYGVIIREGDRRRRESKMNYIIFDLEATCGWTNEHRQSEIIEIGAVKLNDELQIIDEFQAFVRPILNPELTPFCKELTSIRQEDVDNAETFPQVLADFRHWIGFQPNYVLCSWGHYDKKQLIQDIQLHTKLDIDPKFISEHHISIKHQHGTMIGVKKGIGMERALKMYGFDLDGTHHRALDDARNIAKIFIKIFPQLQFPNRRV